MVSCCITLWIPEENRGGVTKKRVNREAYYFTKQTGVCAQKTYQISWRVLPRHNRLISFGHLSHGLLSYRSFSSPSERCGGLQTEHPGCVCVSYVCVCSSQRIHSASSFPCVSVGYSGQSLCLCSGESWMSLFYWLLAWLNPSLCYFVLYALYPHHFGCCFDCLSVHLDYPESFYCSEKYFHLLKQECLLRSVCCLHQFHCSLLSVYIQGCHGLPCVMTLASQASWVPWHQNPYLCENQNKTCEGESFQTDFWMRLR